MNESEIKKALRAWIREHSKLEDAKIVFSQKNSIRLPVPFITIRLGDLLSLGATDEVKRATDLTKPAGQEITQTVIGRREMPVSVQCFGDGDESSLQIMSRVQTSLGLTSVSDALNAAGISVFDIGDIKNVTAMNETAFEQRHLLEVRCYVSEEVSESIGYIKTVQITNLNTGNIFEIEAN